MLGVALLFLKLAYDLYCGATDGIIPNAANDAINMILPAYEYAQATAQAGVLPLWNPHSGIGTPFLADIILGLLYPINWIIFVMDAGAALLVIQLLTIMIGIVGMYCYTRHIGLVWPARVLSTVLFAYTLFTESFHPALGSAFCWLPMLLWLTHRFIDFPSYVNALLIAVCLALCFLAGFPNFFFYTCLTLGIYTLALLILASNEYRLGGIAKRVGMLAVALVLMVGLVAVQLLPTLELVDLSIRSVGSGLAYQSGSIWEVFSLGVMFKNFLLNEIAYIYANDYLKVNSGLYYLGGAVLLLIPFPYLLKKYRHTSIALTATFVFMCLFMLSYHVPELSLLQSIPGASAMRINGRAVSYAQFLLIVLSGVGLSTICDLLRPSVGMLPGNSLKLARVVFPVCAAYLVFMVFSFSENDSLFLGFLICIFLIGLALVPTSPALQRYHLGWIIVVVILLDVTAHRNNHFLVPAFFSEENDFVLANVERVNTYPDHYRVLFAPEDLGQTLDFLNLGTKYRIDAIGTYNSLILARWENYLRYIVGVKKFDAVMSRTVTRRFYGDFSEDLVRFLSSVPGALDSLSLRYIVSATGNSESEGALPRAYAVTQYIQTADEEESLVAVKEHLTSLREIVVLENAAPSFRSADSANANGEVAFTRYTANQVDLTVDLAEPSIVVLNDAYYPGWSAEIDGKRTDIMRANSLFRAIEVPQGTHVISFRYGPGILYWGAGISLLSVILITIIIVRER